MLGKLNDFSEKYTPLACLDPKLISQTPIKAVKLFNEAADCIVEANVYDNSSINIESVVHQFQVFVDENAENGDFKNFNYKNDKHSWIHSTTDICLARMSSRLHGISSVRF